MLLLAIDTSGKHGSLALARAIEGELEVEVIEVVPLVGGTFSAQLVPQIASLLKKHQFQKTNLGAFLVVSGPGSFTGLRVGLAAVKALAEILRKPIAAVSLLEAVARSGPNTSRVLAALDAGRGEVFVGDYNPHPHPTLSERLLSREQYLVEAQTHVVVTPDKGLAAGARLVGGQAHLIENPQSDVIARLGWERIRRGEVISPEDLEANYIRRSDAEIFAKPKV